MRLPPSVARLGLRLRRHVPDLLWRELLELGSLVTDVPAIGLPDFRRALVLAPHPDDESIGCGGAIALLADRGAEVLVVVATDGETTIGPPLPAEEIAARRRAEAADACRILGLGAPPRFLGLPDGGLHARGRPLAAMIDAVLEEHEPDVVLSPWLLETHPDHRAVATALARTDPPRDVQVWGYEAHTPVLPTRAVPITAVLDRKRAALQAHHTAAAAFDLEATLALNRWRSLATDAGQGHAEAFHATTWQDYLRLVAVTNLRRPH